MGLDLKWTNMLQGDHGPENHQTKRIKIRKKDKKNQTCKYVSLPNLLILEASY